MREAKEKFDGLIERIKSGNPVKFGEAERVFAEAFLSHFLKNLERNRQRVIDAIKKQARERDDAYYDEGEEREEYDVSNEDIARHEIEGIRTVASALGVRPKISQLNKYTSSAIKLGDWNLLKDILGLSEEGKLERGALEEVAVSQLTYGTRRSYKELKEQFPDLELSQQKLSDEESKLIYKEIVEQLYMLDRDLRNSQGLDNISNIVSRRGLKAIIESGLTIPVLASIEALSPSVETSTRLSDFAKNADYQEGRELQRRFYHGLSSLQDLENGKEILEHAASISNNARNLAKVLSAISLVSRSSDFQYHFSLTSVEKTLRNLKLQLVDGGLRKIGLTDQNLEKYLERVDKDERFRKVGDILTTLSSYSHYQNPKQIGLIREIIEAELEDRFPEWRYTHNLASEQLAVLEDRISAWKENRRVTRLVGELDALKSHVDAVRDLFPKLQESYGQHYKITLDREEVKDLENKIRKNEEALRQGLPKSEARDLGYETGLLRERIAYTKLLKGIKELSTESYAQILAIAQNISKRRSRNPLFETALWIKDTLDQPVYREARRIIVAETDDLEDMLRMGEIPVPHCQNWKNDNNLNRSLLSFPADANKKLYHFVNGDGKPFGMSLIRLVGNGNMPTLLVENIYSNEWSEDYGTAFIGSLADKALAIYEEAGKPVAIASPIHSGHEAHGRKNIQVLNALKRFAQKYKIELYEEDISIKAARSKNTHEYWDCGFGLVESGNGIELPVKYVLFGGSNG